MKFIDCEGELYLKRWLRQISFALNVGGFNVGGFGDERLPTSSDGVSMLSRDSAASTHPLPRSHEISRHHPKGRARLATGPLPP